MNAELDTLVLKALQKEPDRRYQSAEALRQDVLAYLDGQPIAAKRDSSWYLLKKTVARHKLPAALLAAVVVTLVAFTIALSISYERTRVEAAKAMQIKVFLEDTLASVQPAGVGREVTVREALDEAVQWVEIALADQPEVEASLRNTIGNSYRNLGAFDKAERQLQLALRLREELWGDEHLQVAQSLNTIGLLRRDQGQSDEAERLFRESLGMRRRLLGVDHLDLTNSLMNLGGLQLALGRYAQAEQLYGEALAIRRRSLGPQHADVAMCLYKLAMVAAARSDSADAVRLHKEALAIRRRTLHAEHPDTARSLLALAEALMDSGDASQAEPLLRECFELRRALFPQGHWQIAEVGSLWGACLTRLHKYQEAEPLLLASLEFLQEMRGPSDSHTVAATERCALLYEAWGKGEQARIYRDRLPASTGN